MATKKIRLLSDYPALGMEAKVNVVLELDAAEANVLVKSGIADDDKAAIAYALQLSGGKFITVESAVAEGASQ